MRYRYQSRKSLGRTTRSSKIIRVIRHYASRKFENSEEKGPGSICFCRAPDFIEPGPLTWAPYLGPLSAPYNLGHSGRGLPGWYRRGNDRQSIGDYRQEEGLSR